MTNSVKRAVVLVSGGLDSATTLAIAREQDYECYAISFDYGQRHRCELEAAVKQLYESIENGTYQPGQGELPFMEIVRNADTQLLPFKNLFARIEQSPDNPVNSLIRQNPGPEVPVMARFPANPAPITWPMEEISSSVWRKIPPFFGSSLLRISMILVAGVMG